MVDPLRAIRAFQDALSRRQVEVLALMRDREDADPGCDEAEMVREGRVVYLGDERVSVGTVYALLRACAVSLETDSRMGGVERYRINGTGREILARKGT